MHGSKAKALEMKCEGLRVLKNVKTGQQSDILMIFCMLITYYVINYGNQPLLKVINLQRV